MIRVAVNLLRMLLVFPAIHQANPMAGIIGKKYKIKKITTCHPSQSSPHISQPTKGQSILHKNHEPADIVIVIAIPIAGLILLNICVFLIFSFLSRHYIDYGSVKVDFANDTLRPSWFSP